MPGVSVIIPTWNKAEFVANVLKTLAEQTLRPDEIIVVDNGSTDGTADLVRAGGSRLVRLETNAGFAAAVNAGIRTANYEWLFILNNDVELDPDWLHHALSAAIKECAHFATGKLLQAKHPERLDGAWDLVSRAGCAWRCGWNAPDGPAWNKRRAIQITSLTAALFHRSVFDQVGLLDERYESYYEDVDFGLRSALAGYTGVYEPMAVAKHFGSATLGEQSPRATYLVSRNQVLLAAKFKLRDLSKWSLLAGQFVTLIPALRRGQLLPALKGKWSGIQLARLARDRQPPDPRLREILGQSEEELLQFQRKLGFDLSWRLYFALTRK
jgi:GT2 family glycosyltransferase